MNNVLKIVPNAALCMDNKGVAERLRGLADDMETGDLGTVFRVAVVIDGDQVDHRCYGQQTSMAELVGLLEWAKHRVITGQ